MIPNPPKNQLANEVAYSHSKKNPHVQSHDDDHSASR